jgi:hypothetical protein
MKVTDPLMVYRATYRCPDCGKHETEVFCSSLTSCYRVLKAIIAGDPVRIMMREEIQREHIARGGWFTRRHNVEQPVVVPAAQVHYCAKDAQYLHLATTPVHAANIIRVEIVEA